MAVTLTSPQARRVIRETAVRDGPTDKPILVMLEAGGKILRMKVKGARTWYPIALEYVWLEASVRIKAREILAERQARRQARR